MTSVLVVVEDVSAPDHTSPPACALAAALAGDRSVDPHAGHDVELLSLHGRGRRPVEYPGPRVRVTFADEAVPASGSSRPSALVPPGLVHRLTETDERRLRAVLDRSKAELVVTTSPALLALTTALATAGTAVLHHVAALDPDEPTGLQLLASFGPRADVVTVLDEDAAASVRALLGPVAPRVVVVPHLLGPGWRPRSVPAGPGEPGLVVARGPLFPDDQVAFVVEAFWRVADRLPQWRLRIVGAGRRRPEVMTRVAKRHLFDRVEVVPPVREARADWARADIGVSAARLGGWHLPVLDAMAAGVPFVAMDGGNGTRELVAHEETGLLTVPDSSADLAAAILRLATDPDLRARLGERSAAVALERRQAGLGTWRDALAAALERRRDRQREPSLDPAAAGLVSSSLPAAEAAPPITPQQARGVALALVAGVAERSAPGWFVIPGTWPAPARVAVPAECRDAFLDALATADAPGWLSAEIPAAGAREARRTTVAEAAARAAGGPTPGVVLEPWPGAEGERRSHLAEGARVEVDFWLRDADGAHRTVRGDSVLHVAPPGITTRPVRQHDLDLPVPEPFHEPSTWDVTFPVDVVYTWVDGADPVWAEARARRLAEQGGDAAADQRASGRARFDNRDELRYSLRSLHLFAPWVRQVHLVTAGQRPAWLADHPFVRVVDHRDILPPEALPTFNSHAIETALHRIEGLAEHFVYLNDDVLLTRPLPAEQFFTPGGSAAVFPSRAAVLGLLTEESAPYRFALENVREILRSEFGVVATREMAHTPHPHRVSTLQAIEERVPKDVERTRRTPFRSRTDVALLSSLAQQWGLRTGSAHQGEIDFAYVDVSDPSMHRKLVRLLNQRDRDVLCIGDGHTFGTAPGWVDEELRRFLEAYFPVAAPWERSR